MSNLTPAVAMLAASLATGCTLISEEWTLADEGWRRGRVERVDRKELIGDLHHVAKWFPHCLSDPSFGTGPDVQYAVVQLYAKPQYRYAVPIDPRTSVVKAGDTVLVNVKRCDNAIMLGDAAHDGSLRRVP
jgi:hypothetical protein